MPHKTAYLDDIMTGNNTWHEHLESVEKLLVKLREANLTGNLMKSEFGSATIAYLGHVVGQGKVTPVEAKAEAIRNFPPPRNRREFRRFLGMVGLYRKFCKNFTHMTLPLTKLLKKDEKFRWGDPCQKSFKDLKEMLCKFPILRSPDR